MAVSTPAQAQESGQSGRLDAPGLILEWEISGAQVGERVLSGGGWEAKGTVTSGTVRFSGRMNAAVEAGYWTNSSMSAYLTLTTGANKQTVEWSGELSNEQGLSHELPFDLVIEVPPGTGVQMSASVNRVGGATDLLGLYVGLDPASAAVTSTSAQPVAPPPVGGGTDWGTVGGILAGAAVVIGAAAGVVIGIRRRGKGPKGPQQDRLVLHPTPGDVEIMQGQSVGVTFTAWRVTAQGGYVPAADAGVWVSLPGEAAGLQVTPPSGTGNLPCTVLLPRAVVCAQVPLQGVAVSGPQRAQATALVNIVPLYTLEMGYADPAARLLPGRPGIWVWAKVVATPPDPQSPPEVLTSQIALHVEGPDTDRILPRPLAPEFHAGHQWVQVELAPEQPGATPQTGNPVLVARCVAGRQSLESRLVLNVNTDLEFDAYANGRENYDVLYSETSDPPGWFFGEITAFFHTPGEPDKLVVPPFRSNIHQPEVTVDPVDILQVIPDPPTREGWFTGMVYLRPGADLEQHFGRDLLENGAKITLTLTVTDDTGHPHPASVVYQICPTVELVVRQCGPDGTPFSKTWSESSGQTVPARTDDCLDLRSGEFVADGEDELRAVMYYRRTDWLDTSDRTVSFGSVLAVELEGPAAGDYQVGKDGGFQDVPGRDAAWMTDVSSRRPLLDDGARRDETLTMRVRGGLQMAPPHYRAKNRSAETGQDVAELELKPLHPYVALWVVPGQKRGTSTACAAVWVCGSDGSPQAMLETVKKLELDTVGTEATLGVEEVDRLVKTEGLRRDDFVPIPAWCKVWRLYYGGLTWANLKGPAAVFTVYGRLKDADEAVSFTVNVRENMRDMVADLDANADALDLTNHEWQRYHLTGLLGRLLVRNECRGFLYNARELIVQAESGVTGLPVSSSFTRYTCAAYSKRLAEHLVGRRNGRRDPETALRMNGFEGCQYALMLPARLVFGADQDQGVHDWFGFHLSGGNLVEDPIFIDPWWRQEWNVEECSDDYGFNVQAGKIMAVLALLTAKVMLVGKLLHWIIKAAQLGEGLIHIPSAELVMAAAKGIAVRWGWALAYLTSNIATWHLQTVNKTGQQLDEDFNYARYLELDLFTRYKDDLLKNSPLPAPRVVKWPK